MTRLLSVVGLAWLYCTIGELQPIEYLKSVFLEILNVTTWSVFQNKVTYTVMVKTVLLECFIKVIEYGECSIRVYRFLSNILGRHFA